MAILADSLAAFDECRSPWRFGAVVGVWAALLVGAVNIRSISNDNVPNVLIPVSLLRQGNVELSEFDALSPARPGTLRYWAVQTPAGVYSRYPIWAGAAASPAFAPAVLFSGDRLDEATLLRIGRVVGLVFCGVFAGVMAATLKRFIPGRWAVILTILALLGTTLWHQVGSGLSNQTLPLVCIAGVLALVAPAFVSGEPLCTRRALLAGLLAGLAVASRPPAVFAAAAPFGLLLVRTAHRATRTKGDLRGLVAACIGGLIFPCLTMCYNAVVFGGPLATGYGAESAGGFSADMMAGLAGLLVSPTCGLLVYSPFLLIGLVCGGAALWNLSARNSLLAHRGGNLQDGTSCRNDRTRFCAFLLLGFAGQWLLFSKWWAWNGALTFGGPRMLAETIPLLVLLIALNWNTLRQHRAAMFLLAGGGVFAVCAFLVGTSAFDAIARFDPPKPDWNLRADIVSLYIDRYGLVSLLKKCAINAMMLACVGIVGGWLAARFCNPAQAAPRPATLPA